MADYDEFWKRQRVTAVPLLAQLRAVVLARNAARCPKWKFQVSDLVLQLQPRPDRPLGPLFEGIAVRGADIPADVFKRRVRGLSMLRFFLYADGAQWLFRPVRCSLAPE